MDLYQTLRKVQKKERDNGTLAHVEDTFYKDIHEYLKELRQSAIDNPFSDVYNTLNEARRIATEICERREHKIASAAVLNMNRSYEFFSGEKDFDLVDSMPLNLTPEEETLYFSIIDTLKNHRRHVLGKKIPETSENDVIDEDVEESVDVNAAASLSDVADSAIDSQETSDDILDKADVSLDGKNDEVLDRIDEISNAKVITDEVREPIEKQVAKSKSAEVKKEASDKPSEFDDIEIINPDDQFIDWDVPKRTKESEIVTILVLDDVESIMGIDEKVYGPFRSQDIVTLPKINANIFVKNRKARFVKI